MRRGHLVFGLAIAACRPERDAASVAPAVEVAAPSWPDVLALARGLGLRAPTQAAEIVSLGEHRFAAAIRTTDRDAGDDGARWTTHVLVVGGDPLRVVDRRALISWGEEIGGDHPEHAPVALLADDYDADGQRELLVRFDYGLMICGIGEVGRRELRIYGTTADGHLRPQVALTLDDRIYYGATTGRESFADRNADGRADLVVTSRGDYEDVDHENGDKPIHTEAEVVFTYRPEHDDYLRADQASPAARAVFDFRIWDTCGEGESPGSGPL